MNQRGFSPIFIVLSILLVLGMVGGVYFLGIQKNKETNNLQKTQTQSSLKPNETEDPNKTVTTEWIDFVFTTKGLNLGANFKYPKGWIVSEFGEGNQAGSAYIITIQNYPVEECELQNDCQTLNFQKSSPADGLSPEYIEISNLSVGEKLVKNTPNVGSEVYTRNPDILVDGITSYQYMIERTGKYTPKLTYQVLVPNKKQQYDYYFISSSSEDLLREFISTVKFTSITN